MSVDFVTLGFEAPHMNRAVLARSPFSALLIPQWKQIPQIYGPHSFLSLDFRKLDVVSPLMTDPPDANSTTYTDTHQLSDIGDNLIFILYWCIFLFCPAKYREK